MSAKRPHPPRFMHSNDQSACSHPGLTASDIDPYGGADVARKSDSRPALAPRVPLRSLLSGALDELQHHLTGVEAMRTAMRTDAVHERPNCGFFGLVRTG